MTHEEITSLVRFAKELDRRITALRLSQAEVSRRTALTGAEVISQGYISDILRVGRGDSKKYFRLQRDKVVRLARAVEWSEVEALDFAGFKGIATDTEADRAEEAARTAEMIQNWMTMSPEEQARALEFLKFLREKHPEALKTLGPKFRVITDEEYDQEYNPDQEDIRIEKPKSK